METKPISTAKVYLAMSDEPSFATLKWGERSFTWEALSESGQTTIIVPAGATLSLSSPKALLCPLPFKFALAGSNGISGGRAARPSGITPTLCESITPTITLAHEAWFALDGETKTCTLQHNADSPVAQSHLMITPVQDLPTGWLSPAEGSALRWAFGELAMPAGWSYIITLVQIGNIIQANALPVDLSAPA